MELFEYEKFELVRILCLNRDVIIWCTKLSRAENDTSRIAVENEIKTKGLDWILKERLGDRSQQPLRATNGEHDDDRQEMSGDKMDVEPRSSKLVPLRTVDLDSLVFEEGPRLMANKTVRLPGSTRQVKKGYEEIHVPAPKASALAPGEKLVPISQLPSWSQPAFAGAKSLNRIQSKLYPVAFPHAKEEFDGVDENILLCAPTGAGKTNVAMLTILNEISKHRTATGQINVDHFKIVYIAPLKALVQEMVGNFTKRLETYGIQVAELTGDSQLTKQQIAATQIIVTTPEKWDVITRKATESSYTTLVSLIIIDEIHLLHDDRGPVLESIVARTIRRNEQTQLPVRLIGLSATLPNYQDVAVFLHVSPQKGIFYFDSTFRPCPLKQEFIGITEKKAIKRVQTMNEVAYSKVLEQAGKNQILIFVHSRKETALTAKAIRDKALDEETIGQIMRSDPAAQEILRTEGESVQNPDLRDILPYGFAIHHAGMTRADRNTSEELFAGGYVQVLVSTATLAWGVNLPAHTVIIKGTTIYSPEKGAWVELSPQDVLQMLGRAGRPQYDTYGEGIIITTHDQIQYYLSLMNQQLPIESQFMRRLADNLNAEIVLGTVRDREEAVDWLRYTYLYVRMMKSPALYRVGADYADDPQLEQKRVDLVHSAAILLEKCGLLRYDRASGRFQSTELGRIASHYYITHTSMQVYNQYLSPNLSQIDMFRIFALSDEFKYIPVRESEKQELAKLLERAPIPVNETVEEAAAKINVLLQAYISHLKLEGFALASDMVYVTQSAGRILRALFEICLRKGWSGLAKTTLDLCKMVEKRQWATMTPLRQFPSCPRDVIRQLERKEGIAWSSYFDLDQAAIGELVRSPKNGKIVYQLLRQFPKLEISANVQPITRSLLRVELTISPQFEWDDSVHGTSEAFWIIVEDVDSEECLYVDQFVLRKAYIQDEEQHVEFTVPIAEPLPPNYFISIVSDRWLHSETKLAVSFRHLILPIKFPAPTQLLDLQPLPVGALRKAEYTSLYANQLKFFNKIQTQVFNTIFTTVENVFIGAPVGSGKTICAEFAILRHWMDPDAGRIVYLAPKQESVKLRHQDWSHKFATIGSGKEVLYLTGETSGDLKILEKADLILATPTQWDLLSRRWKQRKNVQNVSLLIADDIHLIGGQEGPTYEVVLSRTRYMAAQLEKTIRIISLSVPLANVKDIGEWLGCSKHNVYNFSPASRPLPLETHLQSYNIPHFPSLMIAMAKPCYMAITSMSKDKPVIVFVPSRKQCRLTAEELILNATTHSEEDIFLKVSAEEMAPFLEKVKDAALRDSLSHGIGLYHEGLQPRDLSIVENLYNAGAIQVILSSRDVVWAMPLVAHLVIIMGTQFYIGREHRYVDYPVVSLSNSIG